MKKTLSVALLCSAVFLAGCDEKTPNDSLTAKTVRPYADADLQEGLAIDGFKRQNGWEDTSAINTYIVRYAYDLKLTKPLPEVVLAAANGIMDELADVKKNPGFMGIKDMQASMSLSLVASEWIGKQQDFTQRRNAFQTPCQPCVAYWNQEGADDVVRARRNAFVYAWSELEQKGFKDAAKPGDKVARTAWASFMKTEQGWMAKQ